MSLVISNKTPNFYSINLYPTRSTVIYGV